MRKQRNIMLAGAAALALIAGASIASAQEGNNHSNGTGMSNPGMTQGGGAKTRSGNTKAPGNMGTGATAESGGQGGMKPSGSNAGAQGSAGTGANKGTAAANGGNNGAAAMNGTNSGANNHGGKSHNGTARLNRNKKPKSAKNGGAEESNPKNPSEHGTNHTAQGRGRHHGTSTARGEEHGIPKGLQGNAGMPMQGGSNEHAHAGRGGGTGVKLTENQRTKIRETIIDRQGAPKAGNVDFDVRVGTLVPRGRIHLITVPEDLVRIEPRWHGLMYFVYEDEIVIVDPRSLKIIAVETV